MSHNFYLYHDPATDQLTWISWDHNMAVAAGRGSRGGGRGADTLDKASAGETWPLIRYLLDAPTCYERYVGYVLAPKHSRRRCRD
jgi:hypothetical protein